MDPSSESAEEGGAAAPAVTVHEDLHRATAGIARSEMRLEHDDDVAHESRVKHSVASTSGKPNVGGEGPVGKDQIYFLRKEKKVLLQKQQRLYLLWHASKCTRGTACNTKVCPQMVKLWQHVKRCRDKKCPTPHCLSSRYIFRHYRQCKKRNQVSTCEVCGPVMKLIKSLHLQEAAAAATAAAPHEQEMGGGNENNNDAGKRIVSEQSTKGVILQKQQQLHLLHHASKCTLGDACPNRSCPRMVKLWQHLKSCHDKTCQTPDCLRSQYVISHHRVCKVVNRARSCDLCFPFMMITRLQEANYDEEWAMDAAAFQSHSGGEVDGSVSQPVVPGMNSGTASGSFSNGAAVKQEQNLSANIEGCPLDGNRSKVTKAILEMIMKTMPDHQDVAEKVPRMAKKLEEHLFHTALNYAEYLDKSTLKKRLQEIARGSDTGNDSIKGAIFHERAGAPVKQEQNLSANFHHYGWGYPSYNDRHELRMAILDVIMKMEPDHHEIAHKLPQMAKNREEYLFRTALTREEYIDRSTLKKRLHQLKEEVGAKVSGNDSILTGGRRDIFQKQERLFLLRHASECTLGAACRIQSCPENVELNRHLKVCSDSECDTPECLSSRYVVHHHRQCKQQNICDVCAPIMMFMDLQNTEVGEAGGQKFKGNGEGVFDLSLPLPALPDMETVTALCVDCVEGGVKQDSNNLLDEDGLRHRPIVVSGEKDDVASSGAGLEGSGRGFNMMSFSPSLEDRQGQPIVYEDEGGVEVNEKDEMVSSSAVLDMRQKESDIDLEDGGHEVIPAGAEKGSCDISKESGLGEEGFPSAKDTAVGNTSELDEEEGGGLKVREALGRRNDMLSPSSCSNKKERALLNGNGLLLMLVIVLALLWWRFSWQLPYLHL